MILVTYSDQRGSPFRARVYLQTWVYTYPGVVWPGELQAICKALEDPQGRRED